MPLLLTMPKTMHANEAHRPLAFARSRWDVVGGEGRIMDSRVEESIGYQISGPLSSRDYLLGMFLRAGQGA